MRFRLLNIFREKFALIRPMTLRKYLNSNEFSFSSQLDSVFLENFDSLWVYGLPNSLIEVSQSHSNFLCSKMQVSVSGSHDINSFMRSKYSDKCYTIHYSTKPLKFQVSTKVTGVPSKLIVSLPFREYYVLCKARLTSNTIQSICRQRCYKGSQTPRVPEVIRIPSWMDINGAV